MDKTILIVDDSPTELYLMAKTLEEQGYKILTATEGLKAREIAMKEHPDLILLDVVLPKANGFQICRELKNTESTKDIKVVFVTGRDQESDKFWGMKQGADGYLTKPVATKELLDNVAELMSDAKELSK